VSGAAALVLQQRPTITPAQLKALLLGSAYRLPGATLEAQGKGELNLAKTFTTSTPAAQTFSATASTGTGTLDAARGSERVIADGVTLTGERDIFGHTWNSTAMAPLEAAGTSWTGGTWNGTAWTGTGWSGSRWSGTSWTGSRWSGSRWSDSSWSSSTWLGSRWSDSSWSSNNWLGSRWSDNAWADASWS
jgi:serine protease AprX